MLPGCLGKKPIVRLVQRNFSHGMFGRSADKLSSPLGQVDLLGNIHCDLVLGTRLCWGGKEQRKYQDFQLRQLSRR